MARKAGLLGSVYDTETKPKKTRLGSGKNSYAPATSRNKAKKPYRGQGR